VDQCQILVIMDRQRIGRVFHRRAIQCHRDYTHCPPKIPVVREGAIWCE